MSVMSKVEHDRRTGEIFEEIARGIAAQRGRDYDNRLHTAQLQTEARSRINAWAQSRAIDVVPADEIEALCDAYVTVSEAYYSPIRQREAQREAELAVRRKAAQPDPSKVRLKLACQESGEHYYVTFPAESVVSIRDLIARRSAGLD